MVIPALAPRAQLQAAAAILRARRLKVVLTDCDGVLTDGLVYYSERGEELKRFSFRDGMGVERLAAVGIRTAIVTRERSVVVEQRARKLGVPLYQGVRDKGLALKDILAELDAAAHEVAYIGDDVNDLGVLEQVASEGLTAAPSDAEESVLVTAHFTCGRAGGHGAFREFAEWILSLRNRHEPVRAAAHRPSGG